MNQCYFDHNSTTPLAPEVLEAMEPFLKVHFANASSTHSMGHVASRAVRQARKQVATYLGLEEWNQIVFTSGGTESNNAAILSALATSGKREMITSQVEHSSVKNLCERLANEGYVIHQIGVNQMGELDIEDLKRKLSKDTAIVSLLFANNETGVIFPIEKIGKIVKAYQTIFHVDAVQAVGKIPVNLQDSYVDMLSLSAHKFCGPKGIGALYVKSGTPFRPLIMGGMQEYGKRAGTENVAGAVGLGKAIELHSSNLKVEMDRIENLRNEFERLVCKHIEGVTINGKDASRLPNTSNLFFDGADAESLLIALDQRGIFASRGSACMSGAQEPSHVLEAMGLSDVEVDASIRISLGRNTNKEEVLILVEALREIISRLRSLEAESVSA